MKRSFFLKFFFCFLIFHIGIYSYGQITNEGLPVSWKFSSDITYKRRLMTVQITDSLKEKLSFKHGLNNSNWENSNRYGYVKEVNWGITNSGVWDELPSGDRIWRINIISTGAESMNLIFDNYQIPEGGTVYIYNDDHSNLIGAYTDRFNNSSRSLGTWLVKGDSIWVEYFEPATSVGKGQLHISKVVHGFRPLPELSRAKKIFENEGLTCGQDVNCSIGTDFDFLQERLRHAVGLILMEGFFCTGTLINNTNQDKAPFFLTANHCNIGLESTWAFRFNGFNPSNLCNDFSIVNEMHTTSGATVLASNSKSDFKLLRLDGGVNNDWDLEWAGWDATAIVPDFVVGIHHPDGAFMEVCRDDDAPQKSTIDFENPNTEIWKISDIGLGWEIGSTTSGSSGSPLFNPNGQIIGQLAGGLSRCRGNSDNDLEDWYGRFDTSWDFGENNSNRLSDWLDPKGTNQLILSMLSDTTMPLKSDIEIFPNPATSVIVMSGKNETILRDYKIFSLTGNLLQQERISNAFYRANVSLLSTGIYLLEINFTDGNENSSMVKKLIISR